jgi:NADH-quinone oxidoreductase subunit E
MLSLEKMLLEFDAESRNLLPALSKISAGFGYVSPEQALTVADYFRVPLSRVYEVASFYDLVAVKKPAALVVQVCSSPNCCDRASLELIRKLENHLRIKAGSDHNPREHLEVMSCLGQCDQGPVMKINGRVFTNVDFATAVELIEKFRR